MRKSERRILKRVIDRTLDKFDGDPITQNLNFRLLYRRLVINGQIKPTRCGIKKCKQIFQNLRDTIEDLGNSIAEVCKFDEETIKILKEKCLWAVCNGNVSYKKLDIERYMYGNAS